MKKLAVSALLMSLLTACAGQKPLVVESASTGVISQLQLAASPVEGPIQSIDDGKVVDAYKRKIAEKIRRNILMPSGVSDDAKSVLDVSLLPGGRVVSVKLNKSSGNMDYDSAVERAIWKSQPLQLPPDVELFSSFRNLRLTFIPKERP